MTDDEAEPPTTLHEDLELLHSIVCDIAKMTPKLKSITNMMLYEAMKKSLDDMTVQQNQLVTAIIERSKDEPQKQKFSELRQRLSRLEADIMAATEMDDIERLGKDIGDATDQYSQQFQEIVKGIVADEKAASSNS